MFRRKCLGILPVVLALVCVVASPSRSAMSRAAPSDGESGVTYRVAAKCLNNCMDLIDYKVTDEDVWKAWKSNKKSGKGYVDETSVVTPGDVRQDLSDFSGQSDQYLVAAKSYLVSHGILDRPVRIEWEDGFTVEPDGSWLSDGEELSKSDLYMMLHKIRFGVIQGRPLLLEEEAFRDGVKMEDSGSDVYLPDQYYYFSGSVYELYLESLLEKGLLLKSEFPDNSEFLETFENNSEENRPVWYASKGVASVEEAGALGETFVYSDGLITRSKPAYFGETERMTLMDALMLIERFMRLTEKDMTKAEADVIAYKYGINYLNDLSDEEADTISFLIAKGVLNFEEGPMSLIDDVTYADIYPILYRVANADARFDFSEVQLTDAEAFWQSKGFASDKFMLTITNSEFIYETELVQEEARTSIFGGMFRAYAADGIKTYTIKKIFDKVNVYTYEGEAIGDLAAMDEATRKAQFPEIIEVGDQEVSGSSVYVFTFEITATSANNALRLVDNKITYRVKDANSFEVSAVTLVSTDSTDTSMISQDAIQRCFSSIEIINDRVLRNTESGAMACLLPESKYALVGNQVFTNRYLLVTDTDNDVYYSMEVIASLLGADIISSYSNAGVVSKVVQTANTSTATVYNSQGTERGSIEYVKMEEEPDGSLNIHYQGGTRTLHYLYNVNQLSNGISSLMRQFSVDVDGDGKKEKMILLVDWVYVVPDLTSFNAKSWMSTVSTGTSLTLDGVFNALYTAPSGGELRDWWDSNLGMSNALANLIFGTRRVEYVKCGYMMPSVTVLLSSDCEAGSATMGSVSNLLLSEGFDLPDTYQRWVGGTTKNFLDSYFGRMSGFTRSSASYQMARRNRSCEIILGKEVNAYVETELRVGNAQVFNSDFYLTPNGVLYRNVLDDAGRLTAKISGNGDSGTLDSISINVESLDTTAVPAGSSIEYNGKKWMYRGVTKIDGSSYLRLTPNRYYKGLFPVFKYNRTSGKYVYSGGASLEADVENIYLSNFGFTEESLTGMDALYKYAVLEADRHALIVSDTLDKSNFKNRNYGFYHGDGDRVDYGVYRVDGVTGQWKKTGVTSSDKVYGIPTVFLPAGSFYTYYDRADSKFKLGKGAVGGALNVTGLFYSGIVDGVIDALLAKELETTTLESLQEGATLKINDVTWTVSDGYLVSKVISDDAVVTLAKTGAYKEAAARLWIGTAIQCDGLNIPLTNYLNDAQLGLLSGTRTAQGEGYLVAKKSGDPAVFLNGKYYGLSVAASRVILRVKLDGSLLVRRVSGSKPEYVMCYSATESIASGVSYPFFVETLSGSRSTKDLVTLSQSSYEMTSNYNQNREEFDREFQSQWQEDFWTWLKMAIICVASYLSVMGWCVYLTVTCGYGVRFLEALAGRGRDGSTHGVDLVKIFSFGIYGLDDPPVFARIFVVTFVCFVLIAICLAIL